jgi:ribosomal protein S18 acetylase RimI-like enzyme
MIRKRISSVDDAVIYQLVVRRLLPFTQVTAPRTKTSFSSVRQRLNGNDFTFVAADGSRAPYGFVTGNCRKSKLFIDMLAIDERHQGRGLGTRLMAAAEAHGRSKGCREAFLYVDEVNPRAQQFYMGKGYVIDGYEPPVYCYRMSKRLQ